MKAIRTRYHGPSNVRGSRISATDGDGHKIVQSYDDALNSEEVHRRAAYALRDKMAWKGELIGGGFQHDMYWVFTR